MSCRLVVKKRFPGTVLTAKLLKSSKYCYHLPGMHPATSFLKIGIV